LTVVAAGTSLPDLFISVKASRAGKDIASLSNVLGSNTFDLLIAVPLGIFLAGPTIINFTRAAPMMGCLTIATIAMFILMRLEMNLAKRDAAVLLLLYVAFVVLMVLETTGLTTLFRS
jgi:cation:H+ antiporter